MSERLSDVDARFCAVASGSIAGRLLRPLVDGWAEAWPRSGVSGFVTSWSDLDRATLRRHATTTLWVAAATNFLVMAAVSRPLGAFEWGTRIVLFLAAWFVVLRVTGERA